MKPPVKVAHLFPLIDEKLIALLRSLSPSEWQLQTLAKQWSVKDVAAHLLDGNMRTISSSQGFDGPSPPAIESYDQLVAYLNELNAVFVNAMKRVSPQLVTDMLEITGEQCSGIMAAAPLFEQARFSVAWACEETSVNWFHIAREYTEKMHHQLQIRNAVNREDELMTRELFYPFIDTLMYGLPYALRNVSANENTVIAVTVLGETGGDWYVQRQHAQWALIKDLQQGIDAHVFIEPAIAWKLFTKGISPGQAALNVGMQGNEILCKGVLEMVAVMA